MGIGRVLVLGLAIWLIWFVFKRLKSTAVSIKSQKQQATKASDDVSNIKQCAVCSVHVPENEAIKKGDLFYCSEAHANRHT